MKSPKKGTLSNIGKSQSSARRKRQRQGKVFTRVLTNNPIVMETTPLKKIDSMKNGGIFKEAVDADEKRRKAPRGY